MAPGFAAAAAKVEPHLRLGKIDTEAEQAVSRGFITALKKIEQRRIRDAASQSERRSFAAASGSASCKSDTQ